jgi:hypothetical protein
MNAEYFVRYIQLARRTMMTLRGKRWSSGLIETTRDKFVPGMDKVPTKTAGSTRPNI